MKKIISIIAILALACSSDEPTRASQDPPPDSRTISERRADSLLALMTLDEKIGQMTQPDENGLVTENDIKDLFIGSVLSGGSSDPASNDPVAWADQYDRFQALALQTRLHIPIIYGVDAVHGHNNVVGATVFPHNIGLGATRNTDLVRKADSITAVEVAATGIDWTFAPCVAVPRNERWGRTYEGFGETPELVKDMARAAVMGYQPRILACAKHYIGDGGTTNGTDQGNTEVDEATLRAIHLPGYQAAIEANVGSIMVSFSSWNGTKMHGQKYLLTDLLKGELGFKGFLVSDWDAINQLPGDYPQKVERSINAGLDMIMLSTGCREFIATMKAVVNDGRIPMTRIDDAVRRILIQKFEYALFDHPYVDRSLLASVGSSAHREVARECVRQSLVLLKNNGPVLPLAKSGKKIFVAGKNANDLGNQCGGWTISWQGAGGNTTVGTTILQGIRNAVVDSTVVRYSLDGTGAAGSDIGVVVIGEKPYAEMEGDKADLSLSTEDLAVIARVKSAGIPVVVVLVTGRPLILTNTLPSVDAVVVAWLPGTEGGGVADVLFGDYHPTGKLPHSWPKTMNQIPTNFGDPNYNPLFPFGFGLSY